MDRQAADAPHMKRSGKRAVRLFYCCAPEDEELRGELEKHLALLERRGVIEGWHLGMLSAGDSVDEDVARHLDEADIVLLLLSASFLASSRCYDVQMQRAMERHRQGLARVIPIRLREADYAGAPFSSLAALPTQGPAINSRKDRDEAWAEVVRSIRAGSEVLVPRPWAHAWRIGRVVLPSIAAAAIVLACLDWLVPGIRNPDKELRGFLCSQSGKALGSGKVEVLNLFGRTVSMSLVDGSGFFSASVPRHGVRVRKLRFIGACQGEVRVDAQRPAPRGCPAESDEDLQLRLAPGSGRSWSFNCSPASPGADFIGP